MKSLTLLVVLAVVSSVAFATTPMRVAKGPGGLALEQIAQVVKYLPVDRIEMTATKSSDDTNVLKAGRPFSCAASKSETVPESVHELRAGDINVVAALGDSITAGLGAGSSSILTLTTPYRGQSWSIGGINDLSSTTTLPNILKKFNPALTGFSTGSGDDKSAVAKLNVAVSGSIAKDMPEQARILIQKLKADTAINYEKDWKLVTLWIGGNDLCAACKGSADQTADNYAAYIEEAIDILQQHVPRVFVNLVQILDVTLLYDLKEGMCDFYHGILCSCGTASSAADRQIISDLTKQYQARLSALAQSPKYATRADFTVVLQPFYTHTSLPKTSTGAIDRTFFAPDCFHYATKGHEEAAIALWNNMLEPVGAKSDFWAFSESISCPSENHPYLFTNQNSAGALAEALQSKAALKHGSNNEQTSTSSSSNVGIIVGVTLPIAVGILAGVTYKLYFKRRQASYTAL